MESGLPSHGGVRGALVVCLFLLGWTFVGSAAQAEPPATQAESADARVVFGAVTLGIGAAAVAAGAVVGGIAAAEYAELDCPNGQCPAELVDDMESYNDLRLPSGLMILGGGLLAGMGAAFLAVGLSDDETTASAVIGPASLHFQGRF